MNKISHYKNVLYKKVIEGNFATPIPTLYKKLDILIGGGLYKNRLYVIGAGTARGKTAFAQNLALIFNKQGYKGLFVSLEMTGEQMFIRFAQMLTGYTYNHLANPIFIKENNIDPKAVMKEIRKKFNTIPDNINIYDNFDTQIDALIDYIRINVDDLDYVIIDYLGLINISPDNKGYGSRLTETSHITREIKKLTKELDIAFILLSQLNREGQKEGIIPQLYHLKESGSVENDADLIILINETNQYTDRNNRVFTFNVAKNRFGQIGKIEMAFNWKTTVFKEVSTENEKEI